MNERKTREGTGEDDAEKDADDSGLGWGPEASDYEGQEDANDPGLPEKHSALLLFLYALATKPSLVHLELIQCGITPFVLDHMPVWPHLLSLDVQCNEHLRRYRFEKAAIRFPSLTSLTQHNCSDAAIAHLVRLPALEELRFPDYLTTKTDGGRVLTSARGFRALSKAANLRAIYYSLSIGSDEEKPSQAALTSAFTLANLTRITISADWLVYKLLVTHPFEHLRCLELIAQLRMADVCCPQNDAQLMPFVKPLVVMVDGRERRQANRIAKRPTREEEAELDDEPAGDSEPIIPVNNAANFPSLECLALPYIYYNFGFGGEHCGQVSKWMKQQLQRSYEYEVAAEWEAECMTLGVVELLKSITT